EADELPEDTGLPLLEQGACANRGVEPIFLPAHNPSEVRLERRGGFVDVVAVQAHRRLEAKGIARAKSTRKNARVASGLQDGLPSAVGRLWRYEDLEPILPRVAGSRDRGAHAGHFPMGEPVVRESGQLDSGKRLQHLEARWPLQREERIARAGVDRDG